MLGLKDERKSELVDVRTELDRQGVRMRALGAALRVVHGGPLHVRLFEQFADASFLTVVLSETLAKLEEREGVAAHDA
jgi:hypothetical protein